MADTHRSAKRRARNVHGVNGSLRCDRCSRLHLKVCSTFLGHSLMKCFDGAPCQECRKVGKEDTCKLKSAAERRQEGIFGMNEGF